MPPARRSPSSATSATCSTELVPTADSPRAADSYAAMQLRHRVRPKVGFVVRVVVWSLAFIVGMTLAILGATGVLPLPIGSIIGLMGFASTGLGLVVGDSLSQETTTNHPMPPNRAGGYFLATLLASYGLGFAGLVALGALPMWCVVFAALGRDRRRSSSSRSSPPRRPIATRRGCVRRSTMRRTSATGSRTSPRPPPASASTPR